jgi:tripartite-type tricarboxylate transporter receptor subunit TctC
MNLKTLATFACGVGALLVPCLNASAQYPEKPIRMFISAAAGDGSDMQVRIITEQIARQLGQNFIIENRPGAGGTIAAREVVRSAPDGYTLLAATQSVIVTSPLLYENAGYDAEGSFEPIARYSRTPFVLVVSPTLGVNDLAGFLKLARSRAPLDYASGGVGTLMHFSSELLARAANLELVHIPYKGAGPALLDVSVGRVPMMMVAAVNVVGLSASGKVKVLFVADGQRAPQLPMVPTAAEAGLPDFEVVAWSAFFAPAKTPKPVLARLSDETVRALRNPAVIDAIQRQGGQASAQQGPEFQAFFRSEVQKYVRLLKGMKVQLN